MTPYQRGNRDGLLNLAAEIDAIVAQYVERAERPVHPKANPTTVARLRESDFWKAEAGRYIAAIARRRAEAMPCDPNAEVEP